MTRFCSIFNQLLQLFPRTEFQKAVIDTKAERHARGFTCWDQFVAMLFAQLGRAHSLREICGGLASCEGKLAHLGAAAPRRSTLAYANAHRPWPLYQACSTRSWRGVERSPAPSRSDSKTSGSVWMRRSSISAPRCFRGRCFAARKVR
jgi:hypothetical protein